MKTFLRLIIALPIVAVHASILDAQTPDLQAPVPNAPQPQQSHATAKPSGPTPAGLGPYAGIFCGLGASSSTASTVPTAGCGAGFSFVPLPIFVEVGILAPQANRSYLTGYVSVDGNIPLANSRTLYLPVAIVGYSRLFETGHAFDYGLALNLPRYPSHAGDVSTIRLELRDYWTFANPTQHSVVVRIGWISSVSD